MLRASGSFQVVPHWNSNVRVWRQEVGAELIFNRQNEVTELFSLLKFLHIKPFCDFERFNSEIAKPVKSGRGVNRAMKKLQVRLYF